MSDPNGPCTSSSVLSGGIRNEIESVDDVEDLYDGNDEFSKRLTENDELCRMYVSGEMEFEELLEEIKHPSRTLSEEFEADINRPSLRPITAAAGVDIDLEDDVEFDDYVDEDDDEEVYDDTDDDEDYVPPIPKSLMGKRCSWDKFDFSQFTKSGLKRRPRAKKTTAKRSSQLEDFPEDDDEEDERGDGRRRRKAVGTSSTLSDGLRKFMGLAEVQLAKNEFSSAIEICEKVIKESPGAWEPYSTLSDIYMRQGEKSKARQFMFLAARLNPSSAEKWSAIIDLAKEAGDLPNACDYAKLALRLYKWPRELELYFRRELIDLYERQGEHKKALEVHQRILDRNLWENSHECLTTARNVANDLFKLQELEKAIEVYLSALRQYPREASDVDRNNTLFLMLHLKQFDRAVVFAHRFCRLHVFGETGGVLAEREMEGALAHSDALSRCELPQDIAPDIVFKVILALIQTKQCRCALRLIATRLNEEVSVEVFDDYYFDVAEALMHKQRYQDAKALMQKMLRSPKLAEKARVWLALGECYSETGEDEKGVEALHKVVSLAPKHLEARVKLSTLLMRLGRGEEALLLLKGDGLPGLFPSQASEELELFQMTMEQRKLLLHRCMTLDATGDMPAFVQDAWSLLFTDFDTLMADNTSCKMTLTYRSTRYRGQAIREIVVRYFARDTAALDRALNWLFPGPLNNFSVDCLWDIFIKMVDGLWALRDWSRLKQACLLGNLFPHFVQDELKLEQCEFLLLTCCLVGGDGRGAYPIAKEYCRQFSEKNQVWNVLNLVAIFNKDLQHNRFVLRELKRDMDNFAANLMNAHNCMIAGSYKYAIASYASLLQGKEDEPLVQLMMGVAFIALVTQKHTTSRHALVIQGFAFLNRYLELRGECQESFYNMGRAFHQVGLYHLAIHYYELALATEPLGSNDDEKRLLDLTRVIAFNLMQVFKLEGNERMALRILQKYLVI